jgi:thioredoxin reductase (NADPH)
MQLHPQTEVVRLHGDTAGLTTVVWRSGKDGEEIELATRPLFLVVGADPNTGWLLGCPTELDIHGSVRTGHGIAEASVESGGRADGRRPDALECVVPGVFAIGDVRAESVKHVAPTVGEGAAVVAQVRRYLNAQSASAQAQAATAATTQAS